MEKTVLLKKIQMKCPVCEKVHEVEERKRVATTIIKDEKIDYEEKYYYCANSKEENEFETEGMTNQNLLNARNAYRIKRDLLTSDGIVEIREKYGLSQVDLARLLGWGEATVSRYESKAIQDDAYDAMLRLIKDNPFQALKFLRKNGDKFSVAKRHEIRKKIIEKLDFYGKEFLARQMLEGEYVEFDYLVQYFQFFFMQNRIIRLFTWKNQKNRLKIARKFFLYIQIFQIYKVVMSDRKHSYRLMTVHQTGYCFSISLVCPCIRTPQTIH